MDCCDLKGRYVSGVGSKPNNLMLIGEAPGEEEEASGFPFVGRCGVLLDEILDSCGITDYYITNVCKCRPPSNRRPKKTEIVACSPNLAKEIEEVSPKFLILLGDTAMKVFFKGYTLKFNHGQARTLDGKTYMFSYHPAAILRNAKLRPSFEMDLRYFARLIHGEKLEPVVTTKSTSGSMAIDTEVERDKLYCVGWAGQEGSGSSVDLSILNIPEVPIFHNSKYDLRVLKANGVDLTGLPFEDTMVKAQLLCMPMGLKTLSSGVLNRPLRNLEEILGSGKKRLPMSDKSEEVLEYCRNDALSTFLLNGTLKLSDPMEDLYRGIDLPIIPIIIELEETGFAVDREFLVDRLNKLQPIVDEIALHFRKLELANINSPKQLRDFLFGRLGLKPSKLTKGGFESTDEETLKGLRSQQPDVVDRLLKYREHNKEITTYLVPWLNLSEQDKYCRIHPEYATEADTGRFISHNPNGQNITRGELRKAIVPNKGYKLVSFDASQLEMKVGAVWSGDEVMLEALKSGEDFHSATAMVLFGKPDGEERYIAKTINFAVFYGGTWRVILREINSSGKMIISRRIAERFENLYFQKFHGMKRKIDQQHIEAKESGKVFNMFGRMRKLYGFGGSRQEEEDAEKQSVNTPVQGTAADMVKLMMIDMRKDFRDSGSRLVLQVHDELVLEVPEVNLKLVDGMSKKMTELLSSYLESDLVFNVNHKVMNNYGEKE